MIPISIIWLAFITKVLQRNFHYSKYISAALRIIGFWRATGAPESVWAAFVQSKNTAYSAQIRCEVSRSVLKEVLFRLFSNTNDKIWK